MAAGVMPIAAPAIIAAVIADIVRGLRKSLNARPNGGMLGSKVRSVLETELLRPIDRELAIDTELSANFAWAFSPPDRE